MCYGPREVKTGGADSDVVLSAVGLEKRPSWGRTLLRSAAESTPALQLALPSLRLLLLPSAPAGAGGKSSLGFYNIQPSCHDEALIGLYHVL